MVKWEENQYNEKNEPVQWVMEVSDKNYIWIDLNENGLYDITRSNPVSVVKRDVKSLLAAKRWVNANPEKFA